MDSRPDDIDGERKSNMKDAASFLLRGGSLLSTPCGICNGVQIRYKGEISCINCGKQQPVDSAGLSSEVQVSNVIDQSPDHHSFTLRAFEEGIEERIAEQFKILKSKSNDLNSEKQRIELIGMYLDLLDRLRNYSQGMQK